MRFDQAGKSVWYGTPDAPAPAGVVSAVTGHGAAGVTVTIGVQPLNASYRVELHYRVNGGAPAKIPAVLFRTDVRAGAQYFTARLPSLRVGDKVDYGVVCALGTLLFPHPSPPHVFPSSFHVVDADHPALAHPALHATPGPHASAPTAHAAAAAAHPASSAHPAAHGAPPQTHPAGHGSHTVEGTVTSPGRGPLAGVLVEIVDKNPGPHVSLASATTDDKGHYKASYSPPGKKAKPDICARAFSAVGHVLLGTSPVRYNASPHETLGVSVPANAEGLPSEYETLTAAITKVHPGKLGDLQEAGEREDITYLAKKLGWDARAIVFAVVADRLAHAPTKGAPALQAPFYYALFRAGFAMDAGALYGATAAAVAEAWKQAVQSGIIPKALGGGVDAATKTFQSLSAMHVLEEKPAIGLSSLKDVVAVTLGNDVHRTQTFAELHVRYKDDLTTFWAEIAKAFGADVTKRLQLDGQLAHLTLNNAPLMTALHRAQSRPPIAAVDDLAWRGFYQPAKWTPLIAAAIPKEIAGGSPGHRRAAYADYLAAQVRLASPLGVVADMVATGALALSPGTTAADKTAIHAFFVEHNGRFSLGAEPVERYLAHNLSATYAPTVIAQIKRLQRVYQITPNDHAFAALLRHGLDSAYAVTRYDPAGFARAFGHDLGGAGVAQQVHAKARVVAGAALQVATTRLAARGAHAGVAALTPHGGGGGGGPLIVSPTMEQLFGSMDFCDCTECRSILSPAAYLVDLLNFIDYPPAGRKNPQTMLLERRPDLQHLPLTCENTNVALPYIDLVNETLEYFVAHQLSLHDFRGHTTDGSITSEELLASPQFVQDSAYATLKSALFPSALPFDRALELVRLHCDAMGAPLHAVMAALHARDASAGPAGGYGWNDILIERVGLSRAEHRLLTDGSLTLRQIYGFSGDAPTPPRPGHAHAALPAATSPAFAAAPAGGPPMHAAPTAAPPAHATTAIAAAPVASHAAPAVTPASTAAAHGVVPANGASNGAAVNGAANESHANGAGAAVASAAAIVKTTAPAPSAAPSTQDAGLLAELSNFQAYCRRVGVSYEDVASILRTRFINPATGFGARVEALAVPFEVLQVLKAGQITDATFVELLPAGLDPVAYGAHPAAHKRDYGPIVAWVKDDANYARMMSLLTIAKAEGADDVCSAATLRLSYANPDPSRHDLRAVDFVRLLRFIRLWKKLGLSIHQTDAVVTALYPAANALGGTDEAADLKNLDAGFTVLLARLGFLFQVRDLLSLSSEHDLPALLACWAPIGTDGRKSLYAKMFLSPSLLRQDAVFAEDANGNVLQGAAKLLDHEAALRSALHLTGPELGLIAGALGFTATTPLTLDNVSAIYRRGWLARTLHLSVVELLALVQCTGLDPFAPLDLEDAASGGAGAAGEMRRAPPMVRFVKLTQALRDASLKPGQALYLLWNRDVSGKSTPSDAAVFGLARSLRADAAAIESQFALTDDPKGDIARGLMALVYGGDATDFFFSLLDGTLTVSAPYSQPDGALPDAVVTAGQGRLTYDDLRKVLTYVGALDDATALPALITAAAGSAPLLTALTALSKASHRAVDPFFASNRSLQAPYAAYVASTDPAPAKRKALLAALLPDLKRRQRDEQALATVTAAAGLDPTFASALLRDPKVLAAAAAPTSPALVDFTALGDPASAVAGESRGFVEVPKGGFYDVAITADAGATVALELDGNAVPLAQGPQGWSNQAPLDLRAGSLIPLKLTITGSQAAPSVRWTTTGVPWQPIPGAALYSAGSLDRLRTSYVRFLKAASLAAGLSLTANEIAYLAASDELKVGGQGWVNALVTTGAADAGAGSALTHVLASALDFARIQTALSPSGESFLAVLQNPGLALAGGGSALLSLTQWDQASVSALLTHFYGDSKLAPLGRLAGFRRVYDAYAMVTTCGIAAAALVKTTNDPTPEAAANLRSALRAQYADADWLTLVKPINDTMRTRQRDALVAFALHHLAQHPATRSIDTPDRLFEYLLMDVEMAACGQTSRVRLALSSIQLFIERALRSLEPEIDPSHISADQWEWMKRYRVWQANREVFLWPENWLDPELRDDPSPIFKDTMGDLLQGDITEDAAASALLKYLAELHEVAKLEPCGMHYAPGDPAAAGEVTHVFARTAGSKRKYFYRRQEHGGWTPWDEAKLGIEDNPVVPIVWNDRLFVFWLQILKQAPSPPDDSHDDEDSPPPKPKELHFDEVRHWSKAQWADWWHSVERYNAYERKHKGEEQPKKLTEANMHDLHKGAQSASGGDAEIIVQAVLCWSEYHDGKWLPANTSDVNTPAVLGTFAPHGPQAFDRSKLRMRASVLADGPLLVHLALESELDHPGSAFLLYNTHSLPIELAGVPAEMLHAGSSQRLASYAASALRVDYRGPSSFTRDVLQTQLPGHVVESQPGSGDPWGAPFLYHDSRNVFFVTSEEIHQPLTTSRRFGFAHPSGVGHGGTVHHFPPLVAPHQSPIAHLVASTTSMVRYDGLLIGPMGRVTTTSKHAGAKR